MTRTPPPPTTDHAKAALATYRDKVSALHRACRIRPAALHGYLDNSRQQGLGAL